LTALTQLRTRDFIATSATAQEVARSMLTEGINVAKAKGIAIPDDTLDTLMSKYTTLGGSNSSMLTDALNEKPMEVEVCYHTLGVFFLISSQFLQSILGNLMREGINLQIPVPTLTMFVQLSFLSFYFPRIMILPEFIR
jgi:hypothetical protein